MNIFKFRKIHSGFCSSLLKEKRKMFLSLSQAEPPGAQVRAGLVANTLTPTQGPGAGVKLLDSAN